MLDNVKCSARWYDHLFSLAYSMADYIDFSSAISLLYSGNKSHVVIILNYFHIQLDLPCYQSNSPMQDYFFFLLWFIKKLSYSFWFYCNITFGYDVFCYGFLWFYPAQDQINFLHLIIVFVSHCVCNSS